MLKNRQSQAGGQASISNFVFAAVGDIWLQVAKQKHCCYYCSIEDFISLMEIEEYIQRIKVLYFRVPL